MLPVTGLPKRRVRRVVPGGVLTMVLVVAGAALAPLVSVAAGPAYDACIRAGQQSAEGPYLDLRQLCADVEETVSRGAVVTRWFGSLARQGQDYYVLQAGDCAAEPRLLQSLERAIHDTEIHRANMEQFLNYRGSVARSDSPLGQFLAAQHRSFLVLSRDLRQSRPEDRCRPAVPNRPDPPPPPQPPEGQPQSGGVLRYESPTVDGHPVAAITLGGNNSRLAADAFCQSQGYSRSVGHQSSSHSPVPTWYPDTRQPCTRGSGCGILRVVDCDSRSRHIQVPGPR